MFDVFVRGLVLIAIGAALIAKQLFHIDVFCYLSFNIICGAILIYLGLRTLFNRTISSHPSIKK